MSVIWKGSVIVKTMIKNSVLLPLNFIFDKAKPTIDPKTITPSVDSPATKTLLKKALKMGIFPNIAR